MKLSRFFPLLLLLALTFSLFGCEKIDLSGGKGTGKDPSSQNQTEIPEEERNTIIVKTTVTGDDTFRPEGGVSPKIREILAKIEAVEQQYGITVQTEIVSAKTLNDSFLRACRGGTRYADVIQTEAGFFTQYYQKGYFLSLEEFGLEFSTGALKQSDGTAYAFRADGWNNPLPTLSNVLFYNERLLRDSGCETPQELYEANVWNWENFLNLCKQFTKANQGEAFALSYPTEQDPALVWATLRAAGVTFFTDDGTCVMDSQEGLDGFSALRSLLSSNVTYRLANEEDSAADFSAKLAFTNRRTAFLVENSSLLFETGEASLSECLGEDLRLISFPALKEGHTGTVFSQNDLFCGITYTANTQLCKEILPVLFSPEKKDEAKEDVIEDYFYNSADGELYFDLLNTATTDTSLILGENRSMVEEYFLQIARGELSAKEYLQNLQTIFNATED